MFHPNVGITNLLSPTNTGRRYNEQDGTQRNSMQPRTEMFGAVRIDPSMHGVSLPNFSLGDSVATSSIAMNDATLDCYPEVSIRDACELVNGHGLCSLMYNRRH